MITENSEIIGVPNFKSKYTDKKMNWREIEMYTYESFEALGAFTLLRPIFITFLVVSLLLFFAIIIPKFKNKVINGITVIGLTGISILVSGQLLFYHGIIVDELGLGGDPVSFYIFLAIVGIGIVNLIIYFLMNKVTKASTKLSEFNS